MPKGKVPTAASLTEDDNVELSSRIKDDYEVVEEKVTQEATVTYFGETDQSVQIMGQLSAALPDMETIVADYQNSPEATQEPNPTPTLNRFQRRCDEIYWKMVKSFDNKLNFSHDEKLKTDIELFHSIIKNQNLDEQYKQLNLLAAKIKGELNKVTQDDDVYFIMGKDHEKYEEAHDPKYAHYKQLQNFDKMCTQLRIQLQLREDMKGWRKAVKDNPNTQLTVLKQAIDTTLTKMTPHLLSAHPDTINQINHCYLETKGWMEARQLMEEYKDLQKILGVKRFLPVGHKRELWKKKRDLCFIKLQQVANELGQDLDELITYTEFLDYEARKPFSQEWFNKQLLKADAVYFDQETQQLTPRGIEYVEIILSEALGSSPKDVTRPRKISTEDLVLLAQYLGRDNLEKYCKLFGLQGDGTHKHPFTMDNLRVILIGMAAERRKEYEPAHIKKLLDAVTANAHNPAVGLGSSPRLLAAMNNRSQNALAENEDKSYHKKNIIYNFARWAREYSYNVVDTSNERYAASLIAAGNPMFLLVMTVFAALTNAKMDNDPACAYNNLLKKVLANNPNPSNKKQYHEVGKDAAKKIVNALMTCANHEDFLRLYPMFSEGNAHLAEYTAIRNYYMERTDNTVPPEVVTIIENKVTEINKLRRSEKIAHEYSYLYVHKKEHLVFEIEDQNLNPMRFEARNIIGPNESSLDVASTGWGVTFYTPVKGEKIIDNKIPLIIMFPGTHNQPGLLRDLATVSPGKHEWSNPKFKQAFLRELNKEIVRLKRDFGNDAQISIELLGHSLGGSDALQAELLILEAMGQNLLETNPQMVNNYIEKINGVFDDLERLRKELAAIPTDLSQVDDDLKQFYEAETSRLNKEIQYLKNVDVDGIELEKLLKEGTNVRRINELKHKQKIKKELMEGLETALGLNDKKRRHYSVTLDSDEDRQIDAPLRKEINQVNISSVSTFCSRGSGMGEADAYATSALMGLIAETDIKIEERVLNVEGDPLRLGGAAKVFGAAFVDPRLPAFQNKQNNIKLYNVQLNTGLGTKKGGFLDTWAENNIAPLVAHVGDAFKGNPYVNSVGFRDGMDLEESQEYRNQITGKWINSQNILVRGLKGSISRGLVIARVFLEVFARIGILKFIPTLVGFVLGSRDWDVSTGKLKIHNYYNSRADELRAEREKQHAYKQQPKQNPLEGMTDFDQMVISLSNLHHMNQMLEEHNSDVQLVNGVLKNYLERTIKQLPEFNELPGEKGRKIYTHLHHQFVKANNYLQQWEGKLKRLKKELADIPTDLSQVNNEDKLFYESQASRLNREIKQLEKEIENHQAFVVRLGACFEGDSLQIDNCKALLEFRAKITNTNQYLQERNPKTVSLETKALMPLIMSLQMQKLTDLQNDANTDPNVLQKQEKELKRAIGEYRMFLVEEDYIAKRVMSSKWLEEKSPLAVEVPFKYLNKNGDRYEISAAGFARIKEILDIANTQYANNEALSTEDLVLLGHFFGRRCVKKVMERYSLKGDGTELHGFTMDNARALLLGAAALFNPDYIQGVSDDHLKMVLKTNAETIRLANDPNQPVKAYLRIFDDFKNYEQNQLASNASTDPIKFFRSLGRGFARAFKTSIVSAISFVKNWGSSSLLAVPYTGDGGPVVRVLGSTIVGGIVDMLTPENVAFSNFSQDLAVLHALNTAKNERVAASAEPPAAPPPEPTHEPAVNKIMEAVKSNREHLKEFFKQYPIFANDQVIFEKFIKNEVAENDLRNLIGDRILQINDWGRAERMAGIHSMHLTSELDFAENGYSEMHLPDQKGDVIAWNMRSVTDTGVPHFRFNCYWPKEKPKDNGPITLMICIPEDIDTANIHSSVAPFTRLLALFRAGHYSLEDSANMEANRRADKVRKKAANIPKQEFKTMPWQNKARKEDAKIRIMKAINDEIDSIERVHGPNANINIELFGRGIAATNCHHIELYILEALAARKAKNEGMPENIYDGDPNGHANELNRGLKNGVNRAIFRDPMKFPQIAHITSIKTYAFSGVGEPGHIAKERAALVGYLARNPTDTDPGLSVEHNLFNVEGDPSAYFGQDNAERYFDTESAAFAGKPISVNYANTASGRGLRNNNWFYNGFMKGNFDFSDLSGTSGIFYGPNCYNTNTTLLNNKNKENSTKLNETLNEQTGHKNKNHLFSEVASSMGYHIRSSTMRLLFMSASTGERLLYRAFQHPITLFIGKKVRTLVYVHGFSWKHDADHRASKTEAKRAQKQQKMEENLGMHTTFFKERKKEARKKYFFEADNKPKPGPGNTSGS